MRDISQKLETLRTASAEATLTTSPGTIKKINEGKVPKGNVLEMARTSGITAAKKTSDLIPLCHQVPLDYVDLEFELRDNEIRIFSEVKAVWKTGVEMEALTAVSVSALTIYDMLKPIDKELEINNIRLFRKKGGKSDFRQNFTHPLKTAVLVFSDSISEGKKDDRSGKIIVERLKEHPVEVEEYSIFPDERASVKDSLVRLSDYEKYDLILTTGGTGLGPRDVTAETTLEVLDKETPGISEAVRIYGFQRTPYAMLSRAVSGVRGKTLIINLPGSSRGVEESMDALFPWVLHSFWILSGGGHGKKL